jgi:hypothetical protein
MVPRDSLALRLRFREQDLPPEPPDIAAFGRSRATPCGARPRPDAQEIGVLAGGGRLPPRAPFVIFFRHAGYAIPAISVRPADPRPDLASWCIRPTVFGYLASVPAPRPRGELRSRAAWIVAACLPLVWLAPALEAEGAPERRRTPVQVPQPPGEPEPSGVAEPSETPTAEPSEEATVEPSEEATVEPAEEVTVEPPPPPEPALQAGASLDPATVDAAWEGVDGFDVELELKGGGQMRGRVGAVQRDTFTLIKAGTGTVLVLPKSGVISLRVRVPGPLPSRTGTGSLVGGTILTAIGAPVFVAGVSILAACPSCVSVHLPMIVLGGAALGGGIPLLVRGARARRAYQEALQERALAPVVLRTPHGWTGGLRFRF